MSSNSSYSKSSSSRSGGSSRSSRVSSQDQSQFGDSEDPDDSPSSGRATSSGSSETSDVRISRLARIMARLDSEENFIKSCSQVEELIQKNHENRKYLHRSFHCLTIPFSEVLQGLTGMSWKSAGICKYSEMLIKIMNAMDTQFGRVWQWLIDFIDKKGKSPKSFEYAVTAHEVVHAMIPKLDKIQNNALINTICEVLEEVPNADMFKIYGSLFVNSLLPYAESKGKHFQDFVDIVIGWMLDENEETWVIPPYCSEVLIELELYFKNDPVFTNNLLSQMIEDAEDSNNFDAIDENDRLKTKHIKTARLLKAFSSVATIDSSLEKDFFTISCERIFACASQCLKQSGEDAKFIKLRFNLLCAMNEFICSCRGVDGKNVRYFLKEELSLFLVNDGWRKWPMLILNDFIFALSTWIETVVTLNQPDHEVTDIFIQTMAFVDSAQSRFSSGSQSKLVRIVQGLLRTRNVVLLQMVYEWITGNLVGITLTENKCYSSGNYEKKVFVLACLADIATNKTGSILSLWALTPSIFDLLMGLMEGCGEDRLYVLELLRAHCSAHSHFVSSIALSRNYLAESPCTRFLNTLMKFWTRKMLQQALPPEAELWVFRWISDFIKTSAHYSAILLETEQSFYKTVIKQLIERPILQEPVAGLLGWMISDSHYQKSDFILSIIRDTCIRVLLKCGDESIRNKYFNIFQRLPFLLLIEPEFEDCGNSGDESYVESTVTTYLEDFLPSFTIPEFNFFLYDLFIGDKTDAPSCLLDGQSLTTVKAAVEFLIQSKLKTTVGRAHDFFYHLQNMLKRYRALRGTPHGGKVPSWKLLFIYELERRLVCCIFESSFVSSGISEAVRSFYLTNKTPCLEWLKRMRSDLAELSIFSKNFPAAYYFASLCGDELKSRYSLLELEDLEGLAGLNEMAGYHYLKGEYEKAQDILRDAELDVVQDVIKRRTETIFKIASGNLQQWGSNFQSPEVLENMIFQIPSYTKTFLNVQFQVEGMCEGVRYPINLHGELDQMSQYAVLDLVKVRGLIRQLPDVSADQKESLECIIVNRMIDLGNLTFVHEWLTDHQWNDVEEKMKSNPRIKMEYFLILAEILYQDMKLKDSAQIYISLLKCMDTDGDSQSSDFKSHVLLKLVRNMLASEEFYNDVTAGSQSVLEKSKELTIKSILDTAVKVAPTNAIVWFEFGNFSYEQAQSQESLFSKATYLIHASHCYNKVIQSESSSKQTRMSVMAMIRLLKLHKGGTPFKPEDVIIDNKWLILLPELAHIEEFRPHLLSRFPEQATFLVATFVKDQKFQRFAQRRGIFDSAAYSLIDANDEALQGACQCVINIREFPIHERPEFDIRVDSTVGESRRLSTIRALIPKNVSMMVREMERIGTTREEVWSWSVQRISADWNKRLSSLRKDLIRELNVEKLKAYIAPVWTYLSELWNETKECETPAELAFVCRNGEQINFMLNRLAACSSSEKLQEILDELMNLTTAFDSTSSSKLAMSNLSPRLFNFDFLDATITLPGVRIGVTIKSVHSVVACLATKTKPKRLMFNGSDGRKYEYLVKGNENLNIDSRIMQFLMVTEKLSEYPTRTYSVTPLGDRGGLIQIVDGAMPLFSLYKKYLTRVGCSDRPSEMFWRRLEAAGSSDRSNKTALMKVFEELVEETSSELISRELFLCAKDIKTWYDSVRTFTRDCAVGSCIGHIAGVGDRHLDNILLNSYNGQLVHVDFSILFGKGESLRIPEKVPFRMTQNFAGALQFPGLPGPFHANLDKLLHEFKRSKEIVEFCMESIAFASQMEDGLPVDPKLLLSVELRSALTLLQHRAADISGLMQIAMREIWEVLSDSRNPINAWTTRLETLTTAERITKKIYRWRRLLANIDPLIQFIVTYAKPVDMLHTFKEIVVNEWTPKVMHFWSHTGIEEVAGNTSLFAQRFDFTETTLQLLLHHIPPPESIIMPKDSAFTSPYSQEMDARKIASVMATVTEKITSVSLRSAQELIDDAQNRENLAYMYEGWTSWV